MIAGLEQRDIDRIIKVLNDVPEVESAFIFGSRAKGSHKKWSDIDLAIKGPKITNSVILHISSILNEESRLPYKFDVVHYESIANTELINHINRLGLTIYESPCHKNSHGSIADKTLCHVGGGSRTVWFLS